MNELTESVKKYFELRDYKWPDVWKAFAFLDTEKAEVFELLLAREAGWVRNNPEDKPAFDKDTLADEIGDVIMMAIVAGIVEGVDPVAALLEKMERKLNALGKSLN